MYHSHVKISAYNMKKLVIDCDPGTDDAQAILMALATSHVEILAITTTYGNSSVENTSLNALRTLKLVDRLDVSALNILILF